MIKLSIIDHFLSKYNIYFITTKESLFNPNMPIYSKAIIPRPLTRYERQIFIDLIESELMKDICPSYTYTIKTETVNSLVCPVCKKPYIITFDNSRKDESITIYTCEHCKSKTREITSK